MFDDIDSLEKVVDFQFNLVNKGSVKMKATKLAAVVALALGLSYPAVGAEFGTKDEAVAMVKKAVEYIKKEGPEKAYAEIQTKGGQFTDRDLYVSVFDMNAVMLAHGANPKLVGKSLMEMQDTDGKYLFKAIVGKASTQQSFWEEYKFAHPVTKKTEPKESYCERLNNTIVCTGVYKK